MIYYLIVYYDKLRICSLYSRRSPGKFDSRTLSRKTLSRWTGRIHRWTLICLPLCIYPYGYQQLATLIYPYVTLIYPYGYQQLSAARRTAPRSSQPPARSPCWPPTTRPCSISLSLSLSTIYKHIYIYTHVFICWSIYIYIYICICIMILLWIIIIIMFLLAWLLTPACMCGLFSKVHVLCFLPDPGAFTSCMHTFPEINHGFAMVWHMIMCIWIWDLRPSIWNCAKSNYESWPYVY